MVNYVYGRRKNKLMTTCFCRRRKFPAGEILNTAGGIKRRQPIRPASRRKIAAPAQRQQNIESVSCRQSSARPQSRSDLLAANRARKPAKEKTRKRPRLLEK
jgi:hypothetical protein